MRDLDLRRRLDGGLVAPDELHELARLSLARRAALIGPVLPLIEHPDATMRAAALAVIAGARGVQAIRAIVRCLDDAEPEVWRAAIAALRVTGRDAPVRYAHALFHPRVEIRREALRDVPHGIVETTAYLRADPACADLTAHTPWPNQRLGLALDLHAAGHLRATELIDMVVETPQAGIRQFLQHEPGRAGPALDAYHQRMLRGDAIGPAPGRDVLDRLVVAIDEAGAYDRGLDHLIATVAARPRHALQRAIVALRSVLVTSTSTELWGALAALEPRLAGAADLDDARAAATTVGLVRFEWPIRPPQEVVDRLLAVAAARGDLALAAAITGLHAGRRLARLVKALGEPAILDALAASDRGWVEICALPPEKPALELRWLQLLEGPHPERYQALVGLALDRFSGERLEAFVDALPRRHRHAAFLAVTRGRLDPRTSQARAIVGLIVARLDRAALTAVLAALLAPGRTDRELEFARVVGRAATDKQLGAAVRQLDDAAARRLVSSIEDLDALPRDREVALAHAMSERTDPVLHAWGTRMLRLESATVAVALPAIRVHRTLDAPERAAIVGARDDELERALRPSMIAPTIGLVDALAARAASASAAACAALLGCADPLPQVAVQLDRFADPSPRFDDVLDHAATAMWRTGEDLSPLAHARLWRWEAHLEALLRWIAAAGGALRALTAIDALPGRLARRTLWRGVAEAITFVRYRDRARLGRDGTTELACYAAGRVDDVVGVHAAQICVALVEGGTVPIAAIRKAVLERTADADPPTRELLARLVRLDGMPAPPPSRDASRPDVALIAEIQACRDLTTLAAWCRDPRALVVQEAVLVLATLGEAGQQTLATLLEHATELAAPVPVVASVALWESPAALARARALAARGDLPTEWQFHLCLGLGDHARALAAVRAPSPVWFHRTNWEALTARVDPLSCAIAVVDAPHHHAYAPSVELLLAEWDTPEIIAALRRFLEVDAARPIDLRRRVARRLLLDSEDVTGLPIVIDELIDDGVPTWISELPARVGPTIARAIADAGLVAGHTACSEKRMWELIDKLLRLRLIDGAVIAELGARILDEAQTALARQTASHYAVSGAVAHARMVEIAEVFAWGVRRGVELGGRMFRIHLTSAERDLGHTFLTTDRIFVSALPMLRREPHGRDVVEGLVLHELGHHAFHRSESAQQIWKQAHAEGLGHLLNLIADEHLERNLRAIDPSYGDRLKRLGAYAFQHAPQELTLASLLGALRGAAAMALIGTQLEVAFDERSVRLRRGAILGELERGGHPLARFARALRMGLGNRHGDPLVAAALELCKRDLRKLDMAGLYELTRELAALFGGTIAVASAFGGPEGLAFGERDEGVFGAGIDDDILQREVERILDPRQRRGRPSRDQPARLQINVNPDEAFDRITDVRRIRGIPEQHRRLAADVQRHATRLRAHLDDLGLRWEPARARMSGRALDRGRLRALVTRGDPKILVARTAVRRTDLFLGTVVDCSGSMAAGNNLERARRFGVLIAEAVRPLPGVEARFFGFTDSLIYDAGDAQDCGVTGLTSDGGNNDAAALYHAARVALASRKRARVLVMISDGLPTQCSVAALRGLVTTLTRRKGIVCAQVAVRRLEEECFPHYLVLDDAALDVAVARFGRMIGDLARRGLGA